MAHHYLTTWQFILALLDDLQPITELVSAILLMFIIILIRRLLRMKSNYVERRFKMNGNTTIVIKSKKDGDIYKNIMTVTQQSVGLEPLISINNPSRSELANKIAAINLEDDQVDMFEGQNE